MQQLTIPSTACSATLGFKGQTVRLFFKGTEGASLKTRFFVDDPAVSITR